MKFCPTPEAAKEKATAILGMTIKDLTVEKVLVTVAADIGSEIVIDQVLMVADGDNISLGTPLVSGASVKAKIVSHGRGDKVHIFKMRRRKHYRKSQGHRQNYTEIEILGIAG